MKPIEAKIPRTQRCQLMSAGKPRPRSAREVPAALRKPGWGKHLGYGHDEEGKAAMQQRSRAVVVAVSVGALFGSALSLSQSAHLSRRAPRAILGAPASARLAPECPEVDAQCPLRRYSVGVIPNAVLNDRLNCAASGSPHLAATAATGRDRSDASARSLRHRSNRRCRIQAATVVPSAANRRCRWRSEM
jgi:hypothetical protein